MAIHINKIFLTLQKIISEIINFNKTATVTTDTTTSITTKTTTDTDATTVTQVTIGASTITATNSTATTSFDTNATILKTTSTTIITTIPGELNYKVYRLLSNTYSICNTNNSIGFQIPQFS